MKKIVVLFLIFTLVIAGLFAGGGAQSGSAAPSSQNQDNSKLKLTIYSAVFEDQTEAVCKAFEQETGIKTACVVLGGGEILARVRAERQNATASLWYGGPCDSHIAGKLEGLIAQYNSPNAANIEAKYKDPDGYWVGTYIGYVGFVSNIARCKELGIEPPKSWADLLNPKLKGEIEMPSPVASATGYVILATVLQLMGENPGWDFMKNLNANMRAYTERGSAPIANVKIGEVAVGICFAHDAIKNQIDGFQDKLAITIPSEGTGYETGAMAILKDGPDQQAARLFYDFALTAKAQEIGQKFGAFQFLTNPTASNPKETQQIANSKTISYNTEWAGSNKNAFQAKWAQLTGR